MFIVNVLMIVKMPLGCFNFFFINFLTLSNLFVADSGVWLCVLGSVLPEWREGLCGVWDLTCYVPGVDSRILKESEEQAQA